MSTQWRDVQVADGSFKAYVAQPSGAPKGGVVVIQEIFGVKADWLASQGYLAIAPDLFWRLEPGVELTDKTEGEWARAFDLMKRFDGAKGVGDIQATLTLARQAFGLKKVGAMGYCLGGLLAYLTGCNTDSDASVGYYGVSIEQQLAQAANAKHPVMLHIAGKDQFVPPAAQDAIKAGLSGNPLFEIHVYAEQDHAFTRVGGAHYDADAAKVADARTIAFFDKALAS